MAYSPIHSSTVQLRESVGHEVYETFSPSKKASDGVEVVDPEPLRNTPNLEWLVWEVEK
jgi:hypothetical protein